jgi:hypothetical protein
MSYLLMLLFSVLKTNTLFGTLTTVHNGKCDIQEK